METLQWSRCLTKSSAILQTDLQNMKLLLSIFFLFVTIKLSAQEKTFLKEYTYKASEMDSKISCRAITINQLRSQLLHEVGVYVQSEQLLKTVEVEGKFQQDFIENISTLSAGITKLIVLEENWNGESFWMKASITIDEKSLEESLKQLINDRQKVKELEEIKQQLNNATREIDKLRKELTVGNKESDRVSQKQQAEKYNNEINTLIAGDYILSGNAKFFLEDFRGAIEDYTKSIEIDSNALAYCNRGSSKSELHDGRGAIEDFTKAIEIDPNLALAYYNRGTSRHYFQDHRGGLADFTKAIEINPNYANAYNNRGGSKSELHDYRGAIEDFTKAIVLNPNDAEAYYNRGLSKNKLQDYQGAIMDFTKAIVLNPNDAEAYYNRGVSKYYLLDHRGAIADYTKSIALNSNHAKAYYSRGLSKFQLNQKDSACLDFSKAGELGYEDAYEAIRKLCQ